MRVIADYLLTSIRHVNNVPTMCLKQSMRFLTSTRQKLSHIKREAMIIKALFGFSIGIIIGIIIVLIIVFIICIMGE